MSEGETSRCDELRAALADVKKQHELFKRAIDDGARTGAYDKAQELAKKLDISLFSLEDRLDNRKIEVEYRYGFEDANGTPEFLESISLNIREAIKRHEVFYAEHGIEIPADFGETMNKIWDRNYDRIRGEVEEYGFNYMLLIPETLPPLAELDEKMTKGYTKDGKQTHTQFLAGIDLIVEHPLIYDGAHIVLLHNAAELDDHPALKDTLNVVVGPSFVMNDQDGYLTIDEYEILQRQLFSKRDEKFVHIDTKRVVRCPGSEMFVRRRGLYHHALTVKWDSGAGYLQVDSFGNTDVYEDLGCRISRSYS